MRPRAKPRSEPRPGWVEIVLAGVLIFDVLFVGWHHFIKAPPTDPVVYWPSFLIAIHQRPVLVVALSVVALLGAASLCVRRFALVGGVVALIAYGLLVESAAAYIGVPPRMFYSVGAALVGYLAAAAYARAVSADDGRRGELVELGALAGLAATYVGAGTQKLIAGAMFDANSLRAHIYTHHPIGDESVFGMIAGWVAETPTVAAALSVMVIAIQAGAWLILLGPRIRAIWGALLLTFHLGTLWFLNILYVEAAVLLLALCFPWPRLFGRPAIEEAGSIEVPARTVGSVVAISAVVIGVFTFVPAPHEVAPAVVDGPIHDEPVRARLGPITVGDELDGWTVVHVEAELDEGTVAFERGPAAVRIGFRCASPGGRPGAFGRAGLRIAPHDTELPVDAFAGAGTALADRLVEAGGEDPCSAVEGWLRENVQE